MAAQTVPALPASIPVVSSVAKSECYSAQHQGMLDQMVLDLVALRNTVDAMVTIFNAHTHKTPTSNPGTTSTPTSDAGGSGSSGGTASSQVTAANIVSGV